MAQESQSGDSTKDATKSYSYDAYGHRISLRNDPVDPAKPTKDYTYTYDVHGSVSALVDEAGSVAASYGYDAYGDKDAGLSAGDPEDDNLLNPYRYSARRLDSGSGTIDMGARRFGPDVARFLQPDLFLGALADLGLSTDPLTANRYALAGGNPLSFLEWDGHMPINDGGRGSGPRRNPTDETEDKDEDARTPNAGALPIVGRGGLCAAYCAEVYKAVDRTLQECMAGFTGFVKTLAGFCPTREEAERDILNTLREDLRVSSPLCRTCCCPMLRST